MSRTFEAKLRRIGNSLGIIIPSEVLDELGYGQGDNVKVIIPLRKKERLLALAGMYVGKPRFKRNKRERGPRAREDD